jgi:hypothetical protein
VFVTGTLFWDIHNSINNRIAQLMLLGLFSFLFFIANKVHASKVYVFCFTAKTVPTFANILVQALQGFLKEETTVIVEIAEIVHFLVFIGCNFFLFVLGRKVLLIVVQIVDLFVCTIVVIIYVGTITTVVVISVHLVRSWSRNETYEDDYFSFQFCFRIR